MSHRPVGSQNRAGSIPQPPGREPWRGCSSCDLRGLGLCTAWDEAPATVGQYSRTVPPGKVLFQQSDPADSIPVICSGWAGVVAQASNGRRQILAFALPGELISYSLLFDRQYRHTAIALSQTACRHFDRQALMAALLSSPGVFGKVGLSMVREKQRADQLITDLGRRSANGRIARLILHVRDRLAARGLTHDQSFEFPLRQTHIADATGLTPVHVNRVINGFLRQGLIEIANRSLKILNPKALALLVEN